MLPMMSRRSAFPWARPLLLLYRLGRIPTALTPTIHIDALSMTRERSRCRSSLLARVPWRRCALHQIATLSANCGQSPLSRIVRWGRREKSGNETLAHRMVAERQNEKVNIERESRLWIVAKARIWASEGWNVVVTDDEGKSYGPADFERLWAA